MLLGGSLRGLFAIPHHLEANEMVQDLLRLVLFKMTCKLICELG